MKKIAYPYLLWLAIFILLPLILIAAYAFTSGPKMELSGAIFSLDNIKKFNNPIFIGVLVKSFILAFKSTVICFILGYPLAYIISKMKEPNRSNMILLFVIPMWMNFLLRTYSWITLLGKAGLLNKLFGLVGLGPYELMYNDTAVMLGMIYNFLPFMVLPIYSVLIKIDNKLVEAAEDLGANNAKIFKSVIFPLSIPGVITGVNMVFIPAVSTFVISSLLGGNKYSLIGNVIEQQFRFTLDWNFGSAISMILMLIILLAMTITLRIDKTQSEQGGGLI